MAGVKIYWFTVWQLLVSVIAILSVLIVLKYYLDRRKIFQLGKKLPGPKPWPIVGNALDFLDKDLDILGKITELNRIYGFVAIWIGPQLNVIICTPEDAEVFYLSPKLLDRSEHFRFLEPVLGKGLITANGPLWKRNRKLMEPAFRYGALKSFIPIFKKQGEVLVRCLERELGKPLFSVLPYVKNCTFDIICETTMGVQLKAQETGLEALENADRLMALVCTRMFNIWQQWDFFYQFCQDGKEFYKKLDSIIKFVNGQIKIKKKNFEELKKNFKDEKEDDNPEKKVFLHQLLLMNEWNDDELREHILTMVIAGYETSASSVCFALVMLGLHQEYQEKAYQEVFLHFDDDDFNDKKLQQLVYLDMVVKETLRLFPTGPLTFKTASDDVLIGKHMVPKGTAVGVNIFAIHRNPEQYENPNSFNPDNFLPENIAKRHPYSFIPFGKGLRKCIGGKFASMSTKILLASILKKYKVEVDIKMEDIQLRDDITLKMKNGYYVRLFKR